MSSTCDSSQDMFISDMLDSFKTYERRVLERINHMDKELINMLKNRARLEKSLSSVRNQINIFSTKTDGW